VVFPDIGTRNVFLYVVRGSVQVENTEVPAHTLGELGREGDSVEISARSDAFLLFGHAQAIGAPVVAHGPFVMNSAEEIRQAIVDYQAGRFGTVE
jgi:quercetin 2,3-dioxygenase